MVLYFSGTGNSQLVAVQLAEMINDEAVSINRYMKKEKKASFHSDRPLVFVAPTYSWRMPGVVEQWILDNNFTGSREAYFILTCGDSCGNAAVYAEKLCHKKGFEFFGLSSVLMPENYIALFPTTGEEESSILLENAKPYVASAAAKIKSGRRFSPEPVSFRDRLESGPVNSLFYTLFVHDKGFRVTDTCISCRKCEQRCPLNNIVLTDGRPRWKGNCTHCMACIGGCPAGAIEYKTKSKGRRRYYIMDDSLCWGVAGSEKE